MNYLERNQLLIAEIGQNLRLQRGKVIGVGTLSTFRSAGNYRSSLLDDDLYVGLKEIPSIRHALDFQVALDLALIRAVEQNLPYMLSEFPIFYGLIRDSKGEKIGVVTEDFSKGGRYEVEDMGAYEELPRELEKFLEMPITDYPLCTTSFLVNGQRRIGDFCIIYLYIHDEFEKFSPYDLKKEIDKYTLHIDYDL